MKVPMLGLMALLGGEPSVAVSVPGAAMVLARDLPSAGAGFKPDV